MSVTRNASDRGVCRGTPKLVTRSENGSVKMARAKRYASGFLAALAILFTIGATAAAAADWYVNPTTGTDANNCMTVMTP